MNNKRASFGDCVGAVVAADTELEARNIYPEPNYLRCDENFYSGYIYYDPAVHSIEQTSEYWFIRNLASEHPDDPTDQFWYEKKVTRGWDVQNIVVTCIGNTEIAQNTVILSSNVGS